MSPPPMAHWPGRITALRWVSLIVFTWCSLGAHTAMAEDPLAAIEQANQRHFEAVAPSVVFIVVPTGFGSGFFVSEDGLILTNAHVVEGAKTARVIMHCGRVVSGTIVERATDKIDLALIRVPVTNSKPLELTGVDRLRIGSWVASVGHGRGGLWTFNTGMVSNIYPSGANRPVFQTQIPLNPGNSGGPIIDRQGNVVGIVTAGLTESNSINFGIKAEVAWGALSQLLPYGQHLLIKAPENVAIFIDGKMVGTGPRVVVSARAKSYQVFVVINGKKIIKVVRFPQTRQADFTR